MTPKKEAVFTECFNPAIGEKIGTSALHSSKDLKIAIEKARSAQRTWADFTVKERTERIKRIRNFLIDHTDELVSTIAEDTGKSPTDALSTEIIPSVMAVNYYCRNAKRFLKDQIIGAGNIALCFKRTKIIRVPFGVIGIISPWNYPFSIPFSEVIMGLLAGNAVILKTSTETQMVGLALKETIHSADLPEGLFAFLNIPGGIAGDAFLENGIDKLFFTGSMATGKYLMGKASTTLTPICLELGGNDAMLVCEDADLDRAAAGAVWAGFQNAAQSCAEVERIYVHGKVYDTFIEKLGKRTESLRVGYDLNHQMDMGCMTTLPQVHKVMEHVDDAVSKGAKVYAKSPAPEESWPNHFLPAVVLTDVNHEMKVMKEETFGPVIGVMRVRDMDEAMELANDSELGLTGSVWSRNRAKGGKIARQIQAGTVTLNDHLMSHGLAEAPWGGFKRSGFGRTHGRLGFDEMTQPQTLVTDIMPFIKRDLWWYPFDKRLYQGLQGMAQVLYGKGMNSRLRGLIKLGKILPRMFKT